MVNAYIVNYDLNRDKNYDALYEKFKTFSGAKRVLKSCWLVMSVKTAEQLRDELLKVMDADDGIFVAKASGEAAWRNVECDPDWLYEKLMSVMAS